MRRFSLSCNKFAHFQSQRRAGDLHHGTPPTDWADLLRSLLDVPISIVGFFPHGEGQRQGLITHTDDSFPAGTPAGVGAEFTQPEGPGGAPAIGDLSVPPALARMLSLLMQPDGMTIIPDLRADDTRSEALAQARTWGVRSLAGIIFPGDGGSRPGVVCVMDRQRRGYTVGELELLQCVAETVRAHESLAVLLERAAHMPGCGPVGRAGDLLPALRELISEEPGNAVQLVAETLADCLEACALEIHERAGQRGMLRLSAAYGQPGRLLGRITARAGSCCQADVAMKTGRTVMSEDLHNSCVYRTAALLRRIGVGRGVSAPIPGGEEPMGAISVYWKHPGAIPPSCVRIIEAIGACLGAAAAWRQACDSLCRRLADPAWVARSLGRHIQTAEVGRDGCIFAASGLFLGGCGGDFGLPDAWSGTNPEEPRLRACSALGPREGLQGIAQYDHSVRTHSGEDAWYRLIRVAVPGDAGTSHRALILQTDITDSARIARLLESPDRIFPGPAEGERRPAVIAVDASGNILHATGDWSGILCSQVDAFTGMGLDPIFPTDCDCGRDTCVRARAELSRGLRKVSAGMAGGFELEFECGLSGEARRIRSRIERIPVPGRKCMAVGLWDVTPAGEEGGSPSPATPAASGTGSSDAGNRPGSGAGQGGGRIEETIARLSYHDPMTGLPNQTLLRDRLDLAVLRARRSGRQLGLLLLDLDRFKIVNDSLGRQAGDQLLRLVARRLVQTAHTCDTVARMGGDEFMILLPEMDRAEDAEEAASRILEAIRQPFRMGGRELFVTGSVGISMFPANGDDAESLIKDADIAMYQAKAVGGNRHELFNPSMTARAYERFGLEADLHQAIRQKEFEVFYQPQFDLDSGVIHCVEALVRWRHPGRGVVLPDQFIPVAEETGLIVPIGHEVLSRSFRDIRGLQRRGHHGLRLSVNVSLRQFHQPALVNQVEELLQETGMNPDDVSLEITESVAMCPMVSCINTLHGLKTLGLRMVLDDFGQGHSSLNRLKRLPIDSIKIDRAFIRRITLDQRDAAIARAIITMAHSLDLSVTAEGVEESGQLEFLRQEGCDAVQGFLFSRPVPLEEIEAMLEEGRRLELAV